MKINVMAYVCCAFIAFVIGSGFAQAQSAAPASGDAALAAGNFDAAASAYADALAKNGNDSDAELGIGTIELYRNHLDAARVHLQRALRLAPDNAIARARLDTIAKRIGDPSDYRIAFAGAQAHVPLIAVDPLPTLRAVVNGLPVTLVIDTGAPNIALSAAVVEKLHLSTKEAGEGVFAGGLKAKVQSTYIDRFELPGVTVRGIPAGVMPGNPGFDGVVGTGFLYHFLSTIDYAHGLLVLRPAHDSATFLASAEGSGAASVPMWLVGDHMMLVHAHVNASPDGLYFIDTGGPGIGVDLTKATLAAAGITPDAAHPQVMMGGGGPTQILPYTAASVTVGSVTEHDLPGVYLPGAPAESSPFPLAGRISHEFFRHTAVTFDFSTMTLVLSRS